MFKNLAYYISNVNGVKIYNNRFKISFLISFDISCFITMALISILRSCLNSTSFTKSFSVQIICFKFSFKARRLIFSISWKEKGQWSGKISFLSTLMLLCSSVFEKLVGSPIEQTETIPDLLAKLWIFFMALDLAGII